MAEPTAWRRRALAAAVLVVAVAVAGCVGASSDADGGATPALPTPAAPAPPPVPQGTPGLAPASTPRALAPSPPFGLTTVVLVAPDGQRHPFEAYVASEPAQRQRGLMEREHLPAGTGMAFLFPGEASGGFWMRNTLIPLDIAFADAAGEVVAVRTMQPCAADPCPTYTPGATYRSAFEANAGELTGLGVGPGWRLELPAGLPTPS